MSEVFTNKVAESGILTVDLEDFLPKEPIENFDLKEYLFMGLILKEKDFRAALLQINWSYYSNKIVGIYCSTDAIIPVWAYMLVTSHLQPYAAYVANGTKEQISEQVLLQNIDAFNVEEFIDKRVVIKGCGDVVIPPSAYTAITFKLRKIVKSIMYGEPCSTVPVYKKKPV